jgi:hypothetical protein
MDVKDREVGDRAQLEAMIEQEPSAKSGIGCGLCCSRFAGGKRLA